MDAAQKSFMLQSQVRHNAEEFRNTLNDLYSWEKQIKDKEHELQKQPAPSTAGAIKKQKDGKNAPPVRSHVAQKGAKGQAEKTTTTAAKSSAKQHEGKQVSMKNKTPTDPTEDQYKQATLIKDEGNEFVKQADYVKAMEKYSAAIDMYSDDPVFFNNRALCYLKLERYYDCIEDCERALDIDARSIKAYYRRMLANEKLGNDLDAYKDCQTLLKIDPKNAEAKKSLQRINNTLLSNMQSDTGPNFSPVRSDMCFITPVDKPPHLRSKKPLRRIPITDVVGPKLDSKNKKNSKIQVSDDVIEKLFNSDCGPFVEVKKPPENLKGDVSSSSSIASLAASTKTVHKTSVKHQSDAEESNSEGQVELKKVKKSIAIPTASPTPSKIKTSEADSNVLSKTNIKETPAAVKEQRSAEILKPDESKKRIPLPAPPISTAQFYLNWNELSAPQKYEYLKNIKTDRLCKMLGAGFDSDTLTEIIFILRNFYVPKKDPSLSATLLEISKNNQIGILSLLMDGNERKAITEILNSLKESNDVDERSAAAVIGRNFNIK